MVGPKVTNGRQEWSAEELDLGENRNIDGMCARRAVSQSQRVLGIEKGVVVRLLAESLKDNISFNRKVREDFGVYGRAKGKRRPVGLAQRRL